MSFLSQTDKDTNKTQQKLSENFKILNLKIEPPLSMVKITKFSNPYFPLCWFCVAI